MPKYLDVGTDDYNIYARHTGWRRFRILKELNYRAGKIEFELTVKNKTNKEKTYGYWFVLARRLNNGEYKEIIPRSDNKNITLQPLGEYKEILKHQRLIHHGYYCLYCTIQGSKYGLIEFEILKAADAEIAKWGTRFAWAIIGAVILKVIDLLVEVTRNGG